MLFEVLLLIKSITISYFVFRQVKISVPILFQALMNENVKPVIYAARRVHALKDS